MNAPIALDWRQLPLEGVSLIEASAGTGKTWNIALLYLRLVLERRLEAQQVLVTTFTDAAAEELRARIRQRLLDAEAALVAPQLPASELQPFLEALCLRDGHTALLTRLRMALLDVDQAPISTIHGFCRRVLGDFPFDTGVPFTLGEIIDEQALIRECVEDFWRRRFLADAIDPWDSAFVLSEGVDGFAKLVRELLAVEADAIEIDSTAGLRSWWEEFRRQDHAALAAMLGIDAAFAKAENNVLRRNLQALLAATHTGDVGSVAWSQLGEKLAPDKLATAGIKAFRPHLSTWPGVLELAAVRQLFARADQRVRNEAALDCARFVREQMRSRLQLRGQTTFRQLIDEVHDRLAGPAGAQLARRLQRTWPVALIDEFQDTDARQWAIFDRIWRGSGSAGCGLILIGDPKQSIYGFRGGDVHCYLAVRDSLPPDCLRSIKRNFRSHPDLLAALNGLYARAGARGLGDSGIEYVEVEPGERERWQAPALAQPLQLRLLSPQKNKPAMDEASLQACADDIAALLNDAQAAVQPGDIAVLVDTNRRIVALRGMLIDRQVPVVGAGRASVLDGEWAQELQLLLRALLDTTDEYALRGALATRLLGATAGDLTRLADDLAGWERQLAWFADLSQRWRRLGPLAVVETVIAAQASRLLATSDGERALTDLRHLGELLQDAAAGCYGPEELYAWLVRERSAASDGGEADRERQLRVESDSARVQLLTVHASKGLQFPIVYVPMAWRDRKPLGSGTARYHDQARRLRLDLGSPQFPQHQAIAQREDLQERLRNLYVALTRAERRCVVYAFADLAPDAGAGKDSRGALKVLLGAALAHSGSGQGSPLEALVQAVPSLAVSAACAGSNRYARPQAQSVQRRARAPAPSPRPHRGNHSFTSLTRRLETAVGAANRAAEDETEIERTPYPDAVDPAPAHPRLTGLAALKGAQLGDAVHGLLEAELLPDAPATGVEGRFATQAARIGEALDRQAVGLDARNADQQLAELAGMLDRSLDSELAPGLALGRLAPTARRPEFEFAFGLDAARWWQLHALLDRHGLGDWWPQAQGAERLRGMMNGFMDLVFEWGGRFHVLDYKTNWLGERLADYAAESLEQAMREHRYGLQALIYSVALHRYLEQRVAGYDPDRHLGDSWYLFVRAVGLAPGAGIWRRRFPQTLIDGLDALFNGEDLSACH